MLRHLNTLHHLNYVAPRKESLLLKGITNICFNIARMGREKGGNIQQELVEQMVILSAYAMRFRLFFCCNMEKLSQKKFPNPELRIRNFYADSNSPLLILDGSKNQNPYRNGCKD